MLSDDEILEQIQVEARRINEPRVPSTGPYAAATSIDVEVTVAKLPGYSAEQVQRDVQEWFSASDWSLNDSLPAGVQRIDFGNGWVISLRSVAAWRRSAWAHFKQRFLVGVAA